jgi:hypothetical protein
VEHDSSRSYLLNSYGSSAAPHITSDQPARRKRRSLSSLDTNRRTQLLLMVAWLYTSPLINPVARQRCLAYVPSRAITAIMATSGGGRGIEIQDIFVSRVRT